MDEVSCIVRGFVRDDLEDVVRLYRDGGEWFENFNVTEDFILNASMRHDFRFYVAEAGREVVGFTGVLFYESVGRGEVGPICVDKKHEGKGVGSKLVEKTVNFLREKNIFRVMVKVKSTNTVGLKFFSGLGFEEEAYLKKYTRDGEDVVQMVKFI